MGINSTFAPANSKRTRSLGVVLAVISILVFFILLFQQSKITGYAMLSYPLVLGLGLLFGGIGVTGKFGTAIKYLGFIFAVALVVLLLSLLFKR